MYYYLFKFYFLLVDVKKISDTRICFFKACSSFYIRRLNFVYFLKSVYSKICKSVIDIVSDFLVVLISVFTDVFIKKYSLVNSHIGNFDMFL